MRFLFLILILTNFYSCDNLPVKNRITYADNVVVAHRGAWKQQNLPENSIASLKHAIALKCSGSEFDVRMTSDDVLVVNHDTTYYDLPIEKTTYAELAKFKLSNGESLPTLKSYLLAGMENNISTDLVCEIKPSKIKDRGLFITEEVLSVVKELNAEPFIASYISFDYDILKRILEINPKANTQYLGGDKSPDELKADGISGLDYHFSNFKRHPEWIKSAKESGLILNAWTANNQEDIDWLLANDFDYITTDEPELLFDRINKVTIY